MSALHNSQYWQSIKNRVGQAVDIVLPPRCVVSGEVVDRQGAVSAKVWRDLHFVAAPYCDCCGYPFNFEVNDKTLCATCLSEEQPFDAARAALVYDDISRDMVLKFKHGDKTHAVHAFIPWLKRAGSSMLSDADFIVPVPLHRWRLLKRRYNQAALIALYLARETAAEYAPDILLRQKATVTQGHLSVKDRAQNVKNAFVISPKAAARMKDKNIVLVDDVYTTGATIRECCKVLRKAGAARIDVLTVARVVRPE